MNRIERVFPVGDGYLPPQVSTQDQAPGWETKIGDTLKSIVTQYTPVLTSWVNEQLGINTLPPGSQPRTVPPVRQQTNQTFSQAGIMSNQTLLLLGGVALAFMLLSKKR